MKEKLTLWLLKRKARKLWKKHNEQFFVVPVINWDRGKYTIMSEKGTELYNRQARKQGLATISFKNMLKMAVYKTKYARPDRLI